MLTRAEDWRTVAELRLEGCPEGNVLCPVSPDPEVDEFFRGWRNVLVPHRRWRVPSDLKVVRDGDTMVLEYSPSGGNSLRERALVTGERSWTDYKVRAKVKAMGREASPTADNSVNVLPMVGLVARMEDSRHYYFLALQPPDKLVLYRRSDDKWFVLDERRLEVDPGRYYELALEVVGQRVRGYLEEEETFGVTDYGFCRGMAGVRFNVAARVEGLRVEMTPGGRRRAASLAERERKELEELSERYPKPVLTGKLDLRRYWPFRLEVHPLTGERKAELVLFREEETSLLTPEGKLIWNFKAPLRLSFPTEPYKDGHRDLVGISGEELVVVDGRDGRILRRRPLPKLEDRETIWRFHTQCPVNLSGGDLAREIIVREGNEGDTLWALDEELEVLWRATVRPRFGHGWSVGFWDVDGDGREEVLAGGTLLSPDGEVIWVMEGAEEVINWPGGEHVDAVALGDLSGDPEADPVAHLLCGSAGVYVLDALTGRIREVHRVGHAQGRSAANYRKDLPGLEVLVGCRWGNYGILNLLSGRGERIVRFQPDFVGQGGYPVNWTGDGEELLLLSSSPEAIGLYDGHGRRVVEIPEEVLPVRDFYGGSFLAVDLLGDPRDELIAVAEGEVWVIGQSDELPKGFRTYKPRRRQLISWPGWEDV